jgi:hypothetical protein
LAFSLVFSLQVERGGNIFDQICLKKILRKKNPAKKQTSEEHLRISTYELLKQQSHINRTHYDPLTKEEHSTTEISFGLDPKTLTKYGAKACLEAIKQQEAEIRKDWEDALRKIPKKTILEIVDSSFAFEPNLDITNFVTSPIAVFRITFKV